MEASDPRAVLGLPLDATRGEAQRAFRRRAKVTHPDAGGDAAEFRAVAGAWADLAAVLPLDRPAPPGPVPRPATVSPHVAAYRAPVSRVVWSELRPSPRPAGAGPDFAAVLRAEMARRAA
ncbi:MAG TPA: J domain-containing protein [Acidimicrobiia bacterium]|nr:J domain-containing protein [Acidimicrobiia bacterium]